MSYMSLTLVTVGVAAVVILGFFLISYMSNLVKNAYQIKVEMRSDMEANFRKIEDELTKKSKWMRAELGEDVTKLKGSLELDNERRIVAIETRLKETIAQLDEMMRADRQDLRQGLETLSRRLAGMDQDVTNLKEEAARRAAIARSRRTAEDGAAATARSQADAAKSAASRMAAKPGAAPAPTGPVADGNATAASTQGPAPSAAAPAATAAAPPPAKPGGAQRMELAEFDPPPKK